MESLNLYASNQTVHHPPLPHFVAPPSIISYPEKITILEGEEVAIVCKIEGVPRPTLSWTKEDKEVVPDQHHLLEVLNDTVVLKIPQCTADDEATYVLKVENPAGSDTVAIPVKVEGRRLLL